MILHAIQSKAIAPAEQALGLLAGNLSHSALGINGVLANINNLITSMP